MLRGILSIIGVLVIAASLLVMLPTIILPNTSLHQIIPVLAPLHEAIACRDDETIRYQTYQDESSYDTHFLCVDASGIERNVDATLRRPGYISVGTLCVGGLLLLGPLIFAMRQASSGAYGIETQNALRMGVEQARRGFAEFKDDARGMTSPKPDEPEEKS